MMEQYNASVWKSDTARTSPHCSQKRSFLSPNERSAVGEQHIFTPSNQREAFQDGRMKEGTPWDLPLAALKSTVLHRWVKKALAFPQPKCQRRKDAQRKRSRWTAVVTCMPQHPELHIRLRLFSHQPFVQAQYEHFEMSADWLIFFSPLWMNSNQCLFSSAFQSLLPWGRNHHT